MQMRTCHTGSKKPGLKGPANETIHTCCGLKTTSTNPDENRGRRKNFQYNLTCKCQDTLWKKNVWLENQSGKTREISKERKVV